MSANSFSSLEDPPLPEEEYTPIPCIAVWFWESVCYVTKKGKYLGG